MLANEQIQTMKLLAAKIRLESFKEIAALGFGHLGGVMSIADVLAVLYGQVMRYDPALPQKEDRDFFVLSKGHAGPALYATLALSGFFPMDRLQTLNKNGTTLPSHCSRLNTPGVDMTTGSLGQGMSTALGLALASRIIKGDNYVYLVLGDGELNEGQVWEGALMAAHQKADNLITFVDQNNKQLDGTTAEVCDLGDIGAKFHAFNWYVQDVDGHDVSALYQAIQNAKKQNGQPSAIIMHTVKGKGCQLAEPVEFNHHIMLSDAAAVQAETARLQQEVLGLENKGVSI